MTGDDARFAALRGACAALAASGTVTLELALAGVPTVAAYRLDALERQVARRVTGWAMAMPNIVADRVVVDEVVNAMVRPERMGPARRAPARPTRPERRAQIDGFAEVRRRLATERPAAEMAAERIVSRASDQRRSIGT